MKSRAARRNEWRASRETEWVPEFSNNGNKGYVEARYVGYKVQNRGGMYKHDQRALKQEQE